MTIIINVTAILTEQKSARIEALKLYKSLLHWRTFFIRRAWQKDGEEQQNVDVFEC